MALHDEVLRAIKDGQVPWRFKTRDLKKIPGNNATRYIVGAREYSENAINTIPRNHSVRPDGTDPGDYVRKGRAPAFFWHGKGEYELILNHEHYVEEVDPEDGESDLAEGDEETLIRVIPRGVSRRPLPTQIDRSLVLRIAEQKPDPVAIIVHYMAEQPFQAHYRRKPVGSTKRGWGARLDAYFWQAPDQNWPTTCSRVSSISSRIQRAIEKLKTCADDAAAADELLDAFKCACAWGSVKLPEPDPRRLAGETLEAVRALSDGREPPSSCRLNSAWTKLYAFAFPDTCVIYDSRVAAALTSILDPAMHLIAGSTKWQAYSRLGTILGRGGSRPRDPSWKWPVGYSTWASQMAANLLCRQVVEELNRQSIARSDCHKFADGSSWTLREVEAVLFMEGY
jgi:hypothetical protein